MTENDAADPRCYVAAFAPMRGVDGRRPLPVKDLSVVGRIVGKAVKLRDFSRGDCQTHEDEEDCKNSAHAATRDSHVPMITPNQCSDRIDHMTGQAA